jgi:hypothetical protein
MWQYSDYITLLLTDPVAGATRLAQHIQEVSDKITADVSADGKSRQSHPLNSYIEMLMKKYDGVGPVASIAGGLSHATFRDD